MFNEQSPDANHAMSKLLVRQAINYAVNKVAIAKIYGGTTLNPILNEAIAPGNIGYTTYNDYPSPNNSGDAAKCKQLLAQAGYPHGFKIIDVYRNAGNHPAVFTSIQSSLKACGITSVGAPQEQGPYYAFIENAANSKKANQWDISEAGWVPDWLGQQRPRQRGPAVPDQLRQPDHQQRLLQQPHHRQRHQGRPRRTQRIGRRP